MNVSGIRCDGAEMLLPDLVLPSRVNQRWQHSGIDSPEHCQDKKRFYNYAHTIDYVYNDRGFRDDQWPESLCELQNAIWCIGDSFTVGIGQPLDHIWPQVLSRRLQKRTINISMDGASNDWIYRIASNINKHINPKLMIVMWSYTHRRESADARLDDEKRRMYSGPYESTEQDFQHWLNLKSRLQEHCNNVIQCAIPLFHSGTVSARQNLDTIKQDWLRLKDPSWPKCPENLLDLDALPDYIKSELQNLHGYYDVIKAKLLAADLGKYDLLDDVIFIDQQLDWARDYHHFDILTSNWVVDRIVQTMEISDFSRIDPLPASDNQLFLV